MPTTGQSTPWWKHRNMNNSNMPTMYLTDWRLKWGQGEALRGMYPDVVAPNTTTATQRRANAVGGAVGILIVFAVLVGADMLFMRRTFVSDALDHLGAGPGSRRGPNGVSRLQ